MGSQPNDDNGDAVQRRDGDNGGLGIAIIPHVFGEYRRWALRRRNLLASDVLDRLEQELIESIQEEITSYGAPLDRMEIYKILFGLYSGDVFRRDDVVGAGDVDVDVRRDGIGVSGEERRDGEGDD